MKKLPEELRNKLIHASKLPPLDPPTVHCLCGKCANLLYDSPEYKIWRTDLEQTIKEPCEICRRPGYDYTILKRSRPLNPYQ